VFSATSLSQLPLSFFSHISANSQPSLSPNCCLSATSHQSLNHISAHTDILVIHQLSLSCLASIQLALSYLSSISQLSQLSIKYLSTTSKLPLKTSLNQLLVISQPTKLSHSYHFSTSKPSSLRYLSATSQPAVYSSQPL
jgi:hypothetical protein